MEHKIKVLILEDLSSDAELAEREIKAVLKNYTAVVTDTEQGFIKALKNFKPDLVISDYMLPAFNGMKALQIIRKEKEFIPFIILTGSMNEETAVKCMQAGADDYVIKEHIKRLGAAILVALDKKKIRQERRQAEEALRESEERFRTVFDNANDIMFIVEVTKEKGPVVVDANNSAFELLGYTRDELIGMPMTELDSEESKEKIPERVKRTMSGGKFNFESLQLRKDGSAFPVEVSASLIKIAGKTYIYSVNRDITERTLAKEKIIQQNEFLNNVLESLTYPFYIIDINDYSIIKANTASGLNLGLNKITCHALTHNSDVPCNNQDHPCPLEIVKKTRKPAMVEHIHIDTAGNRRNVEVYGYPVFDKNGAISSVIEYSLDITERKQAEKELRVSEEKFRKAFSTSPDSININRLEDGMYISINDGFTKITGYSESDVIGKTSLEINVWGNPGDREKLVEGLRKHGQVQNLEAQFRMKDGKAVYGLMSASVITLDRVPHIISITRDITEHKQAEKELIKLSTAVEQSPSVITITDTKGKIEYANPKFTEITGYSLEEAIGQNPRILKSGEHPVEMYKELWKTISSGKTWRGEFHNKKKTGELYWESASVSPIFDEQGNIINYIKVAEDITRQKRNEQIQSIIHNISNTVITTESMKDFIQQIQKELGILMDTKNFFVALYDEKSDNITLPYFQDEKDNIGSFPARKTLTGLVIKNGKTLLIDYKKAKELEKKGEIEKVGSDSEIWLGVPLKNKGKVIGAFVLQSYENPNAYTEKDKDVLEIISNQISISLQRKIAELELKKAKEKAEESNRLKTAFLNNMSHEIRTPLNGITGFISLLQDSEIDDKQKQEFFDIINKSSDRLIATVTDIMDISRIEAGEVKVSKSQVSVNDILEEQYNFFYHEAESKGIKLNYEPILSDSESFIITDKHKLEGILTNLIKNAIKFTEAGSITFGYGIKTSGEKDVIEFYVKDTGIGIPANRVEAIFNRFEQADIADTRAFQGSGLGLAIVKSYVEMLGGKISVKSKEGEGSTFTFSIPYTKQLVKESDAIENINKEPQKSLSHLSLIIVEDDEVSRLFLQTILENKFNKITYTATGKGAIDKCRENPETDIILMDIRMPEMNGYDATREIRKFNKDVVIIAQTAFGLLGDREKAIEAGCNDYISKPIKKEELFEKMRACLDKKYT